MRKTAITGLTMALVLLAGTSAQARIKLVALPEREATLVRLDNPAFTLVEEERTLTLQKGTNQVDFSWKGVNIDPDSIRLGILDHPQEVQLISVSYPPNEAALVWQVHSPKAYNESIWVTGSSFFKRARSVTVGGSVPPSGSPNRLRPCDSFSSRGTFSRRGMRILRTPE